jgi:uncharacterized protein (TIGR02271 family)
MDYPMAEQAPTSRTDGTPEERTVALAKEEAEIRKQEVGTGRVLIKTTVREHEEVLRGQLLSEEVEIDRVALNREVDGPMDARREGDWIIFPMVEEVVVVHKRWMLKEEVRVRRLAVQRPFEERVALRSEEATVEREANKTGKP